MDGCTHSFRRIVPRSVGHAIGRTASASDRPGPGHDTRSRRDHRHYLFVGRRSLRLVRWSVVRPNRPKESFGIGPCLVWSCLIPYISRFQLQCVSHSARIDRTRCRNSFDFLVIACGRLLSLRATRPGDGYPVNGVLRCGGRGRARWRAGSIASGMAVGLRMSFRCSRRHVSCCPGVAASG